MCGQDRHRSKMAASCNDSGVSPSPRRRLRITLAANSSPFKVFWHRLTAANLPLKKTKTNCIQQFVSRQYNSTVVA